MKLNYNRHSNPIFVGAVIVSLLIGGVNSVMAAELTINILAVNGTDSIKKKNIHFALPAELGADDILDTAGLELDYDVNKEKYFVNGQIQLAAKETKNFKVKIIDVWLIDIEDIAGVKNQIEESLKRIENTEFYEVGLIKKKGLIDRLDYIVGEQEKFSDNVEKRIDRFRIYENELQSIRQKALSVIYWKSKPASTDEKALIYLVIELENSSETKTEKVTKKHYLPSEVKPEHLVNVEGFEVKYDLDKGKSFLYREEDLKPQEVRRFRIGIINIWHIDEIDIENLRDRTRKVYKLLQNTHYIDSAGYLVTNIKKNLDKIDASQDQERDIKEHISAFRVNTKRFDLAKKDVESLENLLEAVRENLERSKVKNVLKRVASLGTIAKIAKSLFKKPELNTAWKIIAGIVIAVGILTTIHFIIWGRRSKDVVIEEKETKEEEKT